MWLGPAPDVNYNFNHWEHWNTSGVRLENAFNANGHMGLNNNWDVHAGATLGAVIEFPNRQPVADAGPDRRIGLGEYALLDGTGSDDADKDPLGYDWEILSTTELGEQLVATPTIADGRVYVRTEGTLYSFGDRAREAP